MQLTKSIFRLLLVAVSLMTNAGEASAADFDKITLERGPCYGSCAWYILTIRGNGTVDYVGRASAKRKQLDANAMERLGAEIRKADYFALGDRYRSQADGCPSVRTDHPTAITSVTRGGKTKTINHYLGCVEKSDRAQPAAYPPGLEAFEVAIDRIVGTREWAVETGHQQDQMEILADLEREGRGKDAIKVYTYLARSGNCEAAKRLGDIYGKGLAGADRDYAESRKWYGAARTLGCEVAAEQLR